MTFFSSVCTASTDPNVTFSPTSPLTRSIRIVSPGATRYCFPPVCMTAYIAPPPVKTNPNYRGFTPTPSTHENHVVVVCLNCACSGPSTRHHARTTSALSAEPPRPLRLCVIFSILSSFLSLRHTATTASRFVSFRYKLTRNFPCPPGFHECDKDLRGSPDAISIIFSLKAAISKVLRFTRNLSRCWSFLCLKRQRPARHLRGRHRRSCLLRLRASLHLRLLRLFPLRLRSLRILRP